MNLSSFYEKLDSLFQQHDQNAVETFLQGVIQNEEDEKLKISAANELGCFYRGISLYQKSIAAFLISLNAISDCVGKHSKEYATAIMNMASTYRLSGDMNMALSHFHEAKSIYESEHINDPYGYASILNNMALVYQDSSNPQKAIQYLNDSLAILKSLPDKEIQIATTYNNIALLYQSVEDVDKAESSIDASLSIFRKDLYRSNPHAAASLNTMASFCYKKGKLDLAQAYLLEALSITELNYGKNTEYAACCQSIAQILIEEKKYTDALIYMERAKNIMQSVYGPIHYKTKKAEETIAKLQSKVEKDGL